MPDEENNLQQTEVIDDSQTDFADVAEDATTENTNTALEQASDSVKYEGKDGNNVPSFSMAKNSDGNYLTESYSTYFNYNQLWRLQLGVRYIF